ncbi:unnamed protein product [Ambrosiozyma monospora]|uniref:Unnamed protein product n=1 Tax=Ambrosiozyma monospora TaxID=43982 RepID=A0ACB5TZU2_AMBMO|nr:unnamed protein product [Ambrosiozyma monospora]
MQEDADDDDEFELVGFDPSHLELFPKIKPYVKLPNKLLSVLNDDITKFIVRKDNANWVAVIDALFQDPTKPFRQLNTNCVITLLRVIPRDQRLLCINKIYKMVVDAGLNRNTYVYNSLMATYNLTKVESAKPIVEMLFNEMEQKGIKKDAITYSIMVNLYSKFQDVKKVKLYLSKFKEIAVPTQQVYTSVLQMYVRLNEYELASEVFATMKFLSVNTAPSARTYTSMIYLDVINKNIEHALNLYDELLQSDIVPEADTLLTLARGCARYSALEGWKLIDKYREFGFG